MCKQLHTFFLMSLIGGTAIAGPVMLDDFDADPNDDALGERSHFSSFVNDDPFNQGGSTVIDTSFTYGDEVGAMIMNSGIGARQHASLRYDMDAGAIDLSENGTLAFDFLQVDQSFFIDVVLLDGVGGKAVIRDLQVSAGVDQTVLYDIVNDSIFSNIDLSQLDRFEFYFNDSDRDDDDQFIHTASLDFVLGSIRAVPAPSSLAMLGFGGLVATRRRRS